MRAHLKQQISNTCRPLRKSNYPQLYSDIVEATSFLHTSAKIKERIYAITHDMVVSAKCSACDCDTQFLGPSSGYREFCSCKCAGASDQTITKRKATNLVVYGTEAPAQSQTVRNKMVVTNMERYGVQLGANIPARREKAAGTMMEKYGCSNFFGAEGSQDAITKVFLSRYNVVRYTQVPTYGEELRASAYAKHGKYSFKHLHISQDSIDKLNDKNWLIEHHHIQQQSIPVISSLLGVGPTTVHRRLKLFDIETRNYITSAGEREVYEFIKSVYSGLIIQGDRQILKPQELDVYLPEIKLAIEFNGVFWHSELAGKVRTYHYAKYKECNTQGIRLIQVLDSEWSLQQDIVKSRIKHAIGLSTGIYARKCVVRVISTPTKVDFMANNHIQGDCGSSYNIGLYLSDRLVAVMTFVKPRFNKNVEWELARYANAIDSNVVGGASKLFAYFVDHVNPTSIITYCDLRWGDGNMYDRIGMVESGVTPPNYKYFHPDFPQLVHRVGFQKHKLSSKLEVFNDSLSEWENMQANGYNRIWDCGHKKFIWTNHT